jgi:ABC-type transport system involved in multi-copper enzyme maturation permease subunit
MLSLEGKRLWVLVLAPWPRDRVVTAKFAFALLVGMPVSVSLVVLSGVMLELSVGVVIYQALIIACMVVGFSAGGSRDWGPAWPIMTRTIRPSWWRGMAAPST